MAILFDATVEPDDLTTFVREVPVPRQHLFLNMFPRRDGVVLGGTWDALASGRADLAIGASGELPPGRSYTTRYLGAVQMRFVAAITWSESRDRRIVQ